MDLFLQLMLLVLFVWLFRLQSQVSGIEYSFNRFKEQYIKEKEIKNKSKNYVEISDKSKEVNDKVFSVEKDKKSQNTDIPEVTNCRDMKEVDIDKNIEIPAIKNNMEKTILGNLFNKIGAGALVIAFCFFIKLIEFSPSMQIFTGVLLGCIMIFSAIRCLNINTKMKNYWEVLLGIGFAILFVSIYCSTAYYRLISVATASILAIFLLIATYTVSKKCNSFATLLIGLLGGYINVFFMTSGTFGIDIVDSNIVSVNFIFGYLIFLNLVGILYVFNNPDKSVLNLVNLVITAITVFLYSLSHNSPLLIFPLILWCLYIINDLMFLSGKKYYPMIMRVILWINFAILYIFTVKIFGYHEPILIGATISFAALIYGCAAKYYKSKDYLYGLITAVLLASYYLFEPCLRVFVLALETVLLAYFYKKSRFVDLKNWLILYSGILLTIFCFEFTKQIMFSPSFADTLYIRLMLFASVMASLYISARLLTNIDKKMFQILQMLYITLGYVWAIMELRFGINNSSCEDLNAYLYIIIGFIYSLQINLLSDKHKTKSFYIDISNIFCYLSLTVLLFFSSLFYLEYPVLNFRTLAFVFAMVTLLYLAKQNKNNFHIYAALLTCLWMISSEAKDILVMIDRQSVFREILTVIGLVYAGVITAAGIFKNLQPLIRFGIVLTLVSIIKIVFIDLANIEPVVKTAVFLLLGLILMVVSYFYNKKKR